MISTTDIKLTADSNSQTTDIDFVIDISFNCKISAGWNPNYGTVLVYFGFQHNGPNWHIILTEYGNVEMVNGLFT